MCLKRIIMNFILIGFVIIFGFTTGLPVNNLDEEAIIQLLSKTDVLGRNSALENILINVIEDLRTIMVNGNDDIPVLEPLFIERVFLDDSIIPLHGTHIELNNLTVSKLSTFELNTVSVTSASIILQRYNVVVDGEVPVIEVDVDKYDAFVIFNGWSLFGNGDARIIVIKPRLKVNLLVGIRLGIGAIYLNILETRIEFSLTDIQLAINGMFNDPSVDSFVNIFLRNLVLELLEAYSEEITDTVSPLVQDLANDILSELNLISLLG